MNQEDIDYFMSSIYENCRVKCPACSSERKKKNVQSLGVTVEGNKVLYQCFHCGLSGKYTRKDTVQKATVTAISVPKEKDETLIDKFLSNRGIDPLSVKNFQVVSGLKYFNGEGELDAVGFVYGDNEAIKWRSVQGKNFTQDGAARTFWGIDQVEDDAETIVIVEGECDVLAMACAGIGNVVSVPNGAPQKVSERRVDPDEDKKYAYVWNAKEKIQNAQKIILAVDHDESGMALREELARRCGRAKCFSVDFPKNQDANDILKGEGAERLREIVSKAQPMPLEGVYSADDYSQDLNHLYTQGLYGGVSTGIASVDSLFTIVPGQLSIVTGLPGSGKSEFIDQLMVNLAKREGWKFAVASFENPPALHIAKLSEKYISKPFFDGPTARMSKDEADQALEWVNDHFMFLEQRGGDTATIESILDRARQACMRWGNMKGLVIDPYNYIEQNRKVDNEHQGINELLTRLVMFARANDIHIWFIAHPAKMQSNMDGTMPVPKGMNISGSASFFAKADLGITVHLSPDKTVEIHAWKVRFKWVGTTGKVELDYDVPTGTYSDQSIDLDYEIEEEIKISPHETEKEWEF